MRTIKTTMCLLVFMLCISVTVKAQDNPISVNFEGYDANIEITTEYIKAFNKGDAVKLNSFFNDDALIIGLGGSNDTISKKQHLENYTASFKSNNYNVQENVNLSARVGKDAALPPGDYSFSWGTVSSTNKLTKKTAMTNYHSASAIKDGKISKMWLYYDTLPFALRDGAVVMPTKKM